MATVHIDKGILRDLDLQEYTGEQLKALAEPGHVTSLRRCSFYRNSLDHAVYRGMIFSECSFAKSTLNNVSFYKCEFTKVGLTRTKFIKCLFYACSFKDCDPYYASFENTEVDPRSFKKCYRLADVWNKALVLFSELGRSLLASGEGRLSRKADYYFRIWQRRRLKHLWKTKQMSGFFPWFWSLTVWLLTGYGERPANLFLWALGIISALGEIYARYFRFVVPRPSHGYFDFWYLSLQVFFGKGLPASPQTIGLSILQLAEFGSGLVLIALLIGSVTRKFLP